MHFDFSCAAVCESFVILLPIIPRAGEDRGGHLRLPQGRNLGGRRRDPFRHRAHPGGVGGDAGLHSLEDVGGDALEGVEGVRNLEDGLGRSEVVGDQGDVVLVAHHGGGRR